MENKNTMTEAAREAQRAYHREWRRKNKEKRAVYMANYWAKKAEQAKAGAVSG